MDFKKDQGTEQEKNRYKYEPCVWCKMEKKYGIKIPNHCECESS